MATTAGNRTRPQPPTHRWWHRLLTPRFDLLLGSLLLLFLMVPLLYAIGQVTHPLVGRIGVSLWLAGIVASAVLAVSDDRRARLVALGMAGPTIVAQVLHFSAPAIDTGWSILADVCTLVFLGYTIGLLLRYLFRIRQVSANAIWASICVYLLLGLLWGTAYQLVLCFDANALAGSAIEQAIRQSDLVAQTAITYYFSFVTLTTLGYGDVVPAATTTRMLAVVEAVTGQVYLAVLVARLVGVYAASIRRGASGNANKGDGANHGNEK